MAHKTNHNRSNQRRLSKMDIAETGGQGAAAGLTVQKAAAHATAAHATAAHATAAHAVAAHVAVPTAAHAVGAACATAAASIAAAPVVACAVVGAAAGIGLAYAAGTTPSKVLSKITDVGSDIITELNS